MEGQMQGRAAQGIGWPINALVAVRGHGNPTRDSREEKKSMIDI
ncbi:MAG: hypothetical protein OXQ31_12170 [Spirochaetaceae bacterium]|nr:hypothetical protein [Spirochaetaceae bacterium]